MVINQKKYQNAVLYLCKKLKGEARGKKKLLDRVIIKYGRLAGKQLEDLSHAEAPFIGTEQSQAIPYEFAFHD